MPNATRDLFKGQQYINLETYRKNGVAVRTPVWFAQQDDRLYIWTDGTSGKAKRIRNNPQVRLVPSDARGNPKGKPEPWVTAQACVYSLGTPAYEYGNQLVSRKYGWLKRIFEWTGRNHKQQRAIIEVQLTDA